MIRLVTLCYVLCFVLFFMVAGGLVTGPVALAAAEDTGASSVIQLGQEQPPPPAEQIKLEARYAVLRGTAGTSFEFEVELKYTGKEVRNFDLSAKGPPGFYVSIRPGYEAKEIASIRLDPGKGYPDTVKVVLAPPPFRYAEPGEYTVTLFASSGEIKGSIDLKAIVTAKYELAAETTDGRLNMKATAGEDNPLSVRIINTGSVALNKITFTTEKPGGWSVTFKPDKIDTLSVGTTREVEVTIKPPRKTIAGDYMVTIKVDEDSMLAFDRLDIRVTVLTPTLWGWVGVGIVVAVIAGLAIIFMRLGRR